MTVAAGMPTSKIMGADFLCFLLTPECVDPNNPPSEEHWQTLDFSQYGKTETQIKRFLEQKALEYSQIAARSLTGYFYADLLNQAMSQGLIYRLNNPQEEGKAYYGIPLHVRQTLSLEWQPESMEALTALKPVKEHRTVWVKQLRSFLLEVEACISPEILEYAAQIALNALQQGDLSPADLPVALKHFAQGLGLMPVSHYAGLTVLLEACQGTPFFKQARKLCDCAVDANLLTKEDVDTVLHPAETRPVNPFMALF
jgi:hypothetical protein